MRVLMAIERNTLEKSKRAVLKGSHRAVMCMCVVQCGCMRGAAVVRVAADGRHALPAADAVALDALMAAGAVTRERNEIISSALPLMMSSLGTLTVPQPHVSPHTQGCHQKGRVRCRGATSNTQRETFSGQVQSFQGQCVRAYALNSTKVTLPQPQPSPHPQPSAAPRSQLHQHDGAVHTRSTRAAESQAAHTNLQSAQREQGMHLDLTAAAITNCCFSCPCVTQQ